jgi:hypothetical protein
MRSTRIRRTALAGIVGGAIALIASSNVAQAGPFLPTYTGPKSNALELKNIGVTFNGNDFDLSSTSEAAISSAPNGSLYVWGINRGAGTARFDMGTATSTNPLIGSNVLFDAVLLITPSGTAKINLFNGMAPEIVPTSDITIKGRNINAIIPYALLPSTGFSPYNYGFDLWPRSGAGQNDQIAQFFGTENAVNPADVKPTDVPEPASWAVLATGLALLVAVRRKTGKVILPSRSLTSVA